MPKIELLHIIKSLGRGGAEMLLPETLKLHDKEKFNFHYIYFLPWKNQMVASIEKAGGKVTCFKAKDNIHLFLQYRSILSYCEEHQINLIHCHLPWAGFVGRLIHKKTGIPMLYTEHNMQERYHIATKSINKLSFNYQSMALGVSQDVTDSILKNIKPNIPVKTLLNGVNTKSFQRSGNSNIRKDLGIPQDAIVIGNVAVFRFQKRLKEWLQVIGMIRKKNSNVYGIIVGAGPLEEEIKKEWKIQGLEKIVFFPGLKTDVKPYFQAMDIFMMTSSFEGLPVALLEAMSMECAVVATDAGGIKEVVRNEQDGLTCKVEEWKKLPDLCLNLINEPEELQTYKQAARVRVVQNFSLKRMVEELETIYCDFVTK